MPKAARQETDNVVQMPPVESSTTVALVPSVAESDIARRAFELYCERDCEDGYDVDDWLNAERELREAPSFSAA